MTARDLVLIAVTALLSIAVMTSAAAAGQPMLSGTAAGAMAVLLVVAAWSLNARPLGPEAAQRANAQLMALGYGWGGLALLTVYSTSGVWWQHGRQYGAGMLAIAALIAVYARASGSTSSARARSVARTAALAQAIAAAAGLVFLAGSGKLVSVKGDWPANQVFLAGGIAIALVSVIGYAFGRRTEREFVSGS